MNHKGTTTIRTERLILRRFRPTDAFDAYNNFGADPWVNEFITFTPCKTLDSARNFMLMHEKRYNEDPAFYGWAIEMNRSVIGTISLFNVEDKYRCCELGYCLGSRYWNQGIMTEATAAVFEYAFRMIGFHKISAAIDASNEASKGVIRFLGMRFEGISRDSDFDSDGNFVDMIYYSILEDEWRERAAQLFGR